MSSASSAPRLTVAILARDAAQPLAQTLASLAPLGADVLVADTGSVDDTRAVAVRFGARVVEVPWEDDFSAARNAAWRHVRGQWVLWLDAGEVLPAESTAGLSQWLADDAPPDRAYMLLVVVPPAPGTISGEQIGRIRLVPQRDDVRFAGRVDESLDEAIAAAALPVEGLPWRIVRGAREHDPAVKAARARRNLRLVELEMQAEGDMPQARVVQGEALADLGDLAAAAAAFRLALARCERGSSLMRRAYYGLLAAHDQDPAQRPQQMAVCLEALEVFPLDAQLLSAMGGYLQAENRLDLAARSYRTAAEFGQVDPGTWHVVDIDEIAAICLSLVCQLRGDEAGAREALEAALRRNSTAVRVRRQLIDVHVAHNRRKEALDEFDRLPAETPHREALRSAIRGACLASRQNWVPALAYLQTAYAAGCRDLLCLRWLAVALISTGDAAGALPILRQWQSLEPASAELQMYLAALDSPLGRSPDVPARSLRIDAAAPASPPAPALAPTGSSSLAANPTAAR